MFARSSPGSPFFRFHAAQLMAARRHDTSNPAQACAGHVASEDGSGSALVDLMPSPLPSRPGSLFGAESSRGPRRRQRTACRRLAWVLAEWQLSALNFFCLDCPVSWARVPRRLRQLRPTDVQARAFDGLVEANLAFCRLSVRAPPPLSRGLQRFEVLLTDFEKAWSHDHDRARPGPDAVDTTLAMPVDPLRIKVPDSAGSVRPADFLSKDMASTFLDVSSRIREGWENVRPHRFCFRVGAPEESVLRPRFLETGMAVLIEETQIPCYSNGRPLLAGMFAVPHKIDSDRLIIDRRPQNQGEHRLNWAHLPYGPQLTRIVLSASEVLRGSCDDLRSYFYQLENAPDSLARNAFGRSFDGEGFEQWGGVPGLKYRLALRVVAMGDTNAVCVAQATHRALLQRHGCLRESEELIYGSPLPTGRTFEGLYIDDHFTVAIVERSQLQVASGRDVDIVDAARHGYSVSNLPRAPEKAFGLSSTGGRAVTDFTVIGTEVRGTEGQIGAPLAKRVALFGLSAAALAAKQTTKKLLEKHTGLFIHPIMHRREVMCAFGQLHGWLAGLQAEKVYRIPFEVSDELAIVTVLLPLLESCVRWPVSHRISLTDATMLRGGAVHTHVHGDLARSLYRTCEQRGAYVRLDTATLDSHKLIPPDPIAGEVCRSLRWQTHFSQEFPRSRHVNIQEVEVICHELKEAVRRSPAPERLVNGTDSLVGLGAWAKGRSSSRHLNGCLRRSLGWSLLGRKRLENFHIDSASNAADDPSRDVELRAPDPMPAWLAGLALPDPGARSLFRGGAEAQTCLELFAGAGGLSRAWRAAGLKVGTPYECFPKGADGRRHYVAEFDINREEVRQALLVQARSGAFRLVHIGFPCKTWGAAGRLAGGTRRLGRPLGSGQLERELLANGELAFALRLCGAVALSGNHFSLENPDSSYAFNTDMFASLEKGCQLHVAKVDQCMFGLTLPGTGPLEFCRKRTRIVSSMASISTIARRCPGTGPTHQHARAWGSRRVDGKSISMTAAAGVYPFALCAAWAQSAVQGFRVSPTLLRRAELRSLEDPQWRP